MDARWVLPDRARHPALSLSQTAFLTADLSSTSVSMTIEGQPVDITVDTVDTQGRREAE